MAIMAFSINGSFCFTSCPGLSSGMDDTGNLPGKFAVDKTGIINEAAVKKCLLFMLVV
jgi:hypothetical protein